MVVTVHTDCLMMHACKGNDAHTALVASHLRIYVWLYSFSVDISNHGNNDETAASTHINTNTIEDERHLYYTDIEQISANAVYAMENYFVGSLFLSAVSSASFHSFVCYCCCCVLCLYLLKAKRERETYTNKLCVKLYAGHTYKPYNIQEKNHQQQKNEYEPMRAC